MQQKIDEIIVKVLSGESSTDDNIFLIEWFDNNKDKIPEFAERERLWNAIEIVFNRKKYDHRKAFEKFKFSIKNSKVKPSRSTTLSRSIFKYAAIGLLFLVLGSVITYLSSDYFKDSEDKIIEVKVPAGSRSNLTLSDGTSVWLNAGSKLTYSDNFGKDHRTVHLEGEGFFNVIKDKENPFTVSTTELEIVALGTSFNVKAYPEEKIIQTTLISGSLAVNRENYDSRKKGLVLEPNQQITYYKDSREFNLTREKEVMSKNELTSPVNEKENNDLNKPVVLLSKSVDPEVFTSWKDNRLIFDNESFESIAIKLERRYGAKIIIQDQEIGEMKFKGKFDEISLEQALSALKFASPFDYHINKDTIFIKSQK